LGYPWLRSKSIFDIVLGAGKGQPCARNLLIEDIISLCQMVKFQSMDWRNVSMFWLIALPAFPFFLWVPTIEVRKSASDRQEISQLLKYLTGMLRQYKALPTFIPFSDSATSLPISFLNLDHPKVQRGDSAVYYTNINISYCKICLCRGLAFKWYMLVT
jgi:hypothetical protein